MVYEASVSAVADGHTGLFQLARLGSTVMDICDNASTHIGNLDTTTQQTSATQVQ